MVSSKLILLSVTTLVLGATMLSVLTGSGDQFYFEATSAELGEEEKMYFQYFNGNEITFDLISNFEGDTDDDELVASYVLTRLEAIDGDYRMVSAFLDESYSVIDVGQLVGDDAEPSWSTVDVPDVDELAALDITKLSATLYSISSPNGETLQVGLDADGNPTTFGDMQITLFSKTLAAASSCPTCSIVTGTVGGNLVEQMTEEEIASVEAVDENNRMLADHQRQLAGGVGGNHGCFADGASDAYDTGVAQGVVEKTCNRKSTIAFQGTDVTSFRDLWNDIRGMFDNFRGGWQSVSDHTKRNRYHQVCTGHSLGGAIAKYNAIRGNCGEVVTFASPKTHSFPGNIRITQYINTHKAGWPNCCSRKWWGGCRYRGQYTADPVTMVGPYGGRNQNVRYINGGSGARCWSGLVRSLFSAGLHSMDKYKAKI